MYVYTLYKMFLHAVFSGKTKFSVEVTRHFTYSPQNTTLQAISNKLEKNLEK